MPSIVGKRATQKYENILVIAAQRARSMRIWGATMNNSILLEGKMRRDTTRRRGNNWCLTTMCRLEIFKFQENSEIKYSQDGTLALKVFCEMIFWRDNVDIRQGRTSKWIWSAKISMKYLSLLFGCECLLVKSATLSVTKRHSGGRCVRHENEIGHSCFYTKRKVKNE